MPNLYFPRAKRGHFANYLGNLTSQRQSKGQLVFSGIKSNQIIKSNLF